MRCQRSICCLCFFFRVIATNKVFELIGSEIGLTSLDILKIMAEADNNDDGVIEYREFLPVAVEIIQVKQTFGPTGGWTRNTKRPLCTETLRRR